MIVQSTNRRAETNETSNKIQLILPYSGKQGKKLITKMKKHIRKTLPENVQAIVTYQSKKLSKKFKVKDKAEFYHQSNLENVPIKHVQRTILEKLIVGSRKE